MKDYQPPPIEFPAVMISNKGHINLISIDAANNFNIHTIPYTTSVSWARTGNHKGLKYYTINGLVWEVDHAEILKSAPRTTFFGMLLDFIDPQVEIRLIYKELPVLYSVDELKSKIVKYIENSSDFDCFGNNEMELEEILDLAKKPTTLVKLFDALKILL